MYRYAVLDPRPIPAAVEANDFVFDNGIVYGVEVTIEALAKRCLVNLDPQHTGGGNADIAAIEAALTVALPGENTVFATIRADLDSVGAMAIFAMRRKAMITALDASGTGAILDGVDPLSWMPDKEVMTRVNLVATSDKFARGGWSGPRPLPNRENSWDEKTASAESSRPLAAIAAAVADFKVPLADRVAAMEWWLMTGGEPAEYRSKVEKERYDLISAIENGEIKSETRSDGRIAVVESSHRAATSVGYSLASVVVAFNPSFKLGGGEPHRKFTICTFEEKFVNIKSALAELATLESGWGGSPTIGGSPQGVSSQLTIDEVVAVVEKHLK